MTRLHLVRHGPTHAKSLVGWSDLPADRSDRDAIAQLSNYLPDPAIVVSSDRDRAATTADAIQSGRSRLPHRADLREIHFGDWELRRHSEIEAEDPELARAYWEFSGDVRPPAGESWNEVQARVSAAVDAMITQHKGHDLIIVAHFGVILTQIQRALNLDATEAFAHRIDNLSMIELVRSAAGWHVGRINHRP